MVNNLNKKIRRDLLKMKSQVITIALVIASGVAALVGFLSTQDSLKLAQSRFYQEARFADVFAELSRAPLSLEKRLEQIPGVVSLETRVVKHYLLHLPNQLETAVGRFIAYPESEPPQLNRLYLRQGRFLDPRKKDEILISEGFALANHYQPGDQLAAIINGSYEKFTIVGTVLSPEYIYAIRGDAPVPNDRQYGIFWISSKVLEAAADMEGSFNSLSLIAGPGSSIPQIKADLDELLLDYGGLGSYDRENQMSHRFVSDEINQNRVMAVTIPFIFFSVAAFLLNGVISRMVALQRPQIATLKAMGYSNSQVFLHYLAMTLVIVCLGLVLGCVAGIWIGHAMTVLYTDFYHFPIMTFFVRPWLFLLALSMSVGSGLLGVLFSLRSIFQLQPAEALRPPAPPDFHKNLWEKLKISRFFSNKGKMIYRNLTIHPLRTAFSVLGLSFAVMITLLGLHWFDLIQYLVYSQFHLSQREDLQISFVDPVPQRALQELNHYPGVLITEAYRSVPIKIKLAHRQATSALLGYPQQAQLRLALNQDLEKISIPSQGLLISQLLAKKLHAKPGDLLEIEVLEEKRPHLSLVLDGVVEQWLGFAAYMDLQNLQKLLDDDRISMAAVKIDPQYKSQLQLRLKEVPKIASINFKSYILEMFQKSVVQFLLVFAFFLSLFALVIAV
ncbi:MAG: ABC transporter permease, partial [Deltaproteobacteria bacterium]|nr:ABC transporter permease [Deltaproteobacteria bacterium]